MLDKIQSTFAVYNKLSTWLLLVPMLFFFSNGNFSFTTRTTDAMSAQNAYLTQTAQGIRPQVVLFYGFMLILCFIGYRVTLRGFAANPLVVIPMAWCALSTVWSASPALSMRGTIDLAMTAFFAVYIYEAFATEDLMKLWIFVGSVAAITSLAMIVFLPKYGITQITGYYEWRGITSHKNALGLGMAYLLTPVFFVPVRPWFRAVYSCVLIFLAIMSKSREAWFMVGAVLFFVVWFNLFRRFRDKERLLLVLLTSVLLLTVLSVVLINFDSLMIGIGKDPSMTGRTGIYAAVVDSIAKRPLAGYGYNAFWAPINRESLVVQMTVHWLSLGYAENGILEAALQVGCVGVFLAFLMVAHGFRQGIRLIRSGFYNPRVGWFICLLYLEVLTNIESGWILTPGNLSWIMTIIACVGLADEMSHVRAAQLALIPNANTLQPMPVRS